MLLAVGFVGQESGALMSRVATDARMCAAKRITSQMYCMSQVPCIPKKGGAALFVRVRQRAQFHLLLCCQLWVLCTLDRHYVLTH
jgi:hypothetical protein